MQFKPQIGPGMSSPEVAAALYKAGFTALDGTRRGEATVVVPANALIDLCIAYGDAREGSTDNLEWSLAVAAAEAQQAKIMLQEIANILDVGSPAWEIAMQDPWSEWLRKNGEPVARDAANGILKAHGAPELSEVLASSGKK